MDLGGAFPLIDQICDRDEVVRVLDGAQGADELGEEQSLVILGQEPCSGERLGQGFEEPIVSLLIGPT